MYYSVTVGKILRREGGGGGSCDHSIGEKEEEDRDRDGDGDKN